MANPWFRLYSEFATDHKVQMLSETYQRRLVMLFCFRCNGNETLHDEAIAFQLRISSDDWTATKAEFVRLGFIDFGNNVLNWDKRQFRSDTSSERVKEYRKNMKRECNVTVTAPDTDTDTEYLSKDKYNNKSKKPEDVSQEVWEDFKKLRKGKRAAITETTIKGIRTEAEKIEWGLERALAEMCARGWQGFKASWVTNEGDTNGKAGKYHKTGNSERARAAAFAGLEITTGARQDDSG